MSGDCAMPDCPERPDFTVIVNRAGIGQYAKKKACHLHVNLMLTALAVRK